jgi:two-component system, cell cycle response regulator DivK
MPEAGIGGVVLVVEDDEDSQFVYRVVLERHGFEVASAYTGFEGLRLAYARRPKAIVMDVSIAGIDGWTLTKRLKSDPEMADIPVIVITAHAFPEDRGRARQVGCDGFLTKPCEPSRVLDEVVRVVGA